MEELVLLVMKSILEKTEINNEFFVTMVMLHEGLNIKKEKNGLWYGEYSGVIDGYNDDEMIEWLIGYIQSHYDL